MFTYLKSLYLPITKRRLRRQLSYFHINDESMFPELESASKYIVEQYR
jgi:hypothetical protein